MDTPVQSGTSNMAKVQKTVMIHEDLHRLCLALEEAHGVTFARIITAALIQYFFHPFTRLVPLPDEGPDSGWTRVAIFLERGVYTVAEIPKVLMNINLNSATALAKFHAEGTAEDDPDKAEAERHKLKVFSEMWDSWEKAVQDSGGEMEAIIKRLTD
jgi:hypothetical protein